ncbi:synaptotagmin-15 [Heptranchias perlo]|uniref:synaptotagmin-15 n=1 Tax=Heptranchias perlo TaxID=212740 RepID=UPI00355968C7
MLKEYNEELSVVDLRSLWRDGRTGRAEPRSSHGYRRNGEKRDEKSFIRLRKIVPRSSPNSAGLAAASSNRKSFSIIRSQAQKLALRHFSELVGKLTTDSVDSIPVSESEAAVIIGGIFFFLLIGVAVYLWRAKCSSRIYQDLYSTLSLAHTSSSTNSNNQHQAALLSFSSQPVVQRIKNVQFVVPPKYHVRERLHLGNDKCVGADSPANSNLDLHHSLFESMGACALGALIPDLYKFPEEDSETDYPEGNIGRLWLAVQYEQEMERLMVTLIKVRNLRSPSGTSKFFVKVCLLPNERFYIQSRTKHQTRNSQLNERIVFQVSNETLSQRTLKVLVYDIDKQKKHQLIGQVILPLNSNVLSEDGKLAMWKDLETGDLEVPSEYGDINFSLSYNGDLGQLTVLVLRAKGLKFQEERGLLNAYVKVSLMNHNRFLMSKKTTVVPQTSHPVFNEIFHVKVDQSELDAASLRRQCTTTWENRVGSQLLGRVVLGPFMYARGKQLKHWNKIINKPKELVTQWHALSKGM